MHTVDIIMGILVVIAAVRSGLRGLVQEVLSMASVLLGIVGGLLWYQPGAAFIRSRILEDVAFLPEILAFAVIFCVIFVVVQIVEAFLRDIIAEIRLGALDHVLGFVFGLVEGGLLVAVIVFLLSVQPLFDVQPLIAGSYCARTVMPLIQTYSPAALDALNAVKDQVIP